MTVMAEAGFWRGKISLWPIGESKKKKPPDRYNDQRSEREDGFRKIVINYYEHVYRLLSDIGAFETQYLPSYEEKAFFTERVGAYFLEGMFPHGNNRPINGRKNRINPELHLYLLQYLPLSITFPPNSPNDVVLVEQSLDSAAQEVYGQIYQDLLQKRQPDQLIDYFQAALKGKEMPLSYGASPFVRTHTRRVLSEYQLFNRVIQS